MKKTIKNTMPLLAASIATMIARPFAEAAVAEPPKESKPDAEEEEEVKLKLPPPPNPKPKATETVTLKNLITDADTQNRVSIEQDTVVHYSEIIKDAKKSESPIPLPPLSAVRSKEGKLYLWDGFHRLEALKKAHETTFDVDLYEVPKDWDAVEYAQLLALGANATHGKQRTNRDIQRAVKNALANPDIAAWTNTVIANWVGVSEGMIRNHRQAVGNTVRIAKRGGRTVKINTKNIGKGKGAGKADKEAKKAAKAAAKKGKGKEKAPAKAKTESVVDTELRNAIIRISGALKPDTLSTSVRKGLEAGTISLPRAEIIAWAKTSPERIGQVAPLVLDLDMKPTRAFALLDKELAGNTNLDSLAILLLTKVKRVDAVGNLEVKFHGDGTATITAKKK